jgi:hypothetical protein
MLTALIERTLFQILSLFTTLYHQRQYELKATALELRGGFSNAMHID